MRINGDRSACYYLSCSRHACIHSRQSRLKCSGLSLQHAVIADQGRLQASARYHNLGMKHHPAKLDFRHAQCAH